jgi:hypothetical protein
MRCRQSMALKEFAVLPARGKQVPRVARNDMAVNIGDEDGPRGIAFRFFAGSQANSGYWRFVARLTVS